MCDDMMSGSKEGTCSHFCFLLHKIFSGDFMKQYVSLLELVSTNCFDTQYPRGFNERRLHFKLYSVAWCCRLIVNMERWILIILVIMPGKAIHSLNQFLANKVRLIKF